jgi:hypothetical protein
MCVAPAGVRHTDRGPFRLSLPKHHSGIAKALGGLVQEVRMNSEPGPDKASRDA